MSGEGPAICIPCKLLDLANAAIWEPDSENHGTRSVLSYIQENLSQNILVQDMLRPGNWENYCHFLKVRVQVIEEKFQ